LIFKTAFETKFYYPYEISLNCSTRFGRTLGVFKEVHIFTRHYIINELQKLVAIFLHIYKIKLNFGRNLSENITRKIVGEI
jgi:hypothetical protein